MSVLIQLGILFRSLPQIEGRKKLQKMVHILQSFGVPFDVRFGYHHYGPFSDQLQDLLQTFQHDGLIKETSVNGAYPTSRFTPEPKLLEFLEKSAVHAQPEWVALAEQLNQKSPRELEAISTLIYLDEQQKLGELAEPVDAAFVGLKPALSELLPGAHAALAEFRAKFSPAKLAA